MAYTNINVDPLPTILAGPMVRRVEAGSVSIWLAMKEAATVTVTVLKEDGTSRVLTGSSQTLQVGTSLHLCTVTVRGAGLEAGCRYLYQVTTHESFKTLLGSDAVLTALCYSPNTLPSFYVPPATADGLRIAHGGHRMCCAAIGFRCLIILESQWGAGSYTVSRYQPRVAGALSRIELYIAIMWLVYYAEYD